MAISGFSLGSAKASVDLATVLGLLAGFAILFIVMILGGSPSAFLDFHAFLIVVGGTFAVTTMCFSLGEIGRTGKVITELMFRSHHEPAQAATRVMQLAESARKTGPLALQNLLEDLSDEPFLYKGILMAVDAAAPDDIEHMMRRDQQATIARQNKSVAVLRKAAEVSPAMGLIGTLIGLVEMLGNLADPSAIGPGMAVALIGTFYGAVLANMVFSPLASKLERNASEESLIYTVFTLATASIARQENPRRLEMLLNSVLPPGKRIQYFD